MMTSSLFRIIRSALFTAGLYGVGAFPAEVRAAQIVSVLQIQPEQASRLASPSSEGAAALQFPGGGIAQGIPQRTNTSCPQPALSRIRRHRIARGETLATIAQQYNLIPATLMGMNPPLRSGNAPVGTEIRIPPYNGIQIEVPQGANWPELSRQYGVRADALYEANGCPPTMPRVAFIPGVNWSPAGDRSASTAGVLTAYPLPNTVSVLTNYGWQVDPASRRVVFHSGIDLTAERGTPVLAAGQGTIAYAGNQGNFGNLIVINHPQGLQTRYAQLQEISVQVGQTVNQGDRIGTVGATGDAPRPHLHFEVRSNSNLGWVAQDPSTYFRAMRIGR